MRPCRSPGVVRRRGMRCVSSMHLRGSGRLPLPSLLPLHLLARQLLHAPADAGECRRDRRETPRGDRCHRVSHHVLRHGVLAQHPLALARVGVPAASAQRASTTATRTARVSRSVEFPFGKAARLAAHRARVFGETRRHPHSLVLPRPRRSPEAAPLLVVGRELWDGESAQPPGVQGEEARPEVTRGAIPQAPSESPPAEETAYPEDKRHERGQEPGVHRSLRARDFWLRYFSRELYYLKAPSISVD